jgi:phosphonatase-like hydrolase
MTVPQLVVFDLAGTTIKDNDNVHAAFQQAFREEGIDVSREEANKVMGYPKPHAIEQLLKEKSVDPIRITHAYINKIHRRFLQEMLNFYRNDPNVEEKAGVSETFRALRQHNIKVAIDTGFSRDITDAIFERVGWLRDGLLDASISSDEVPNGRPHPDMIYRLMKMTGVQDVRAVVKVGDTASDMQQGTAAGCQYVIGVTTGAYSREDLAKEPHSHLIEQLPEVLDILGLAQVSQR